MLTSGDIIQVDLGTPIGSEAGTVRPVVVVTAQRILDHSPRVLQVVPLTTTLRGWTSEVTILKDEAVGLAATSAAQCQHVRAISIDRVVDHIDALGSRGNVGPLLLHQIRETLATLLDLG